MTTLDREHTWQVHTTENKYLIVNSYTIFVVFCGNCKTLKWQYSFSFCFISNLKSNIPEIINQKSIKMKHINLLYFFFVVVVYFYKNCIKHDKLQCMKYDDGIYVFFRIVLGIFLK